VKYPVGKVSPTALVLALTRAGVGADTLNSVAGKLLAAPYLQGGVALDTLSSGSSPLLDRDMHGGPVRPTVVVAVKQALGVRLPCRVVLPRACGLRRPPRTGAAERARVCCALQRDKCACCHPPFLFVECRGSLPLECRFGVSSRQRVRCLLRVLHCAKQEEEAQRKVAAEADAARKQAEVRTRPSRPSPLPPRKHPRPCPS
jgi:hypothetical protein